MMDEKQRPMPATASEFFALMTAYNDLNARLTAMEQRPMLDTEELRDALQRMEARLTAIEQRLAREDAAAAIQRGTMEPTHRLDLSTDPAAFRIIEGDDPK
jgi:hypothetical protein